MFVPASRFLARVLCLALLCLPLVPAHAFGPQTHLWLAQRAQQDINRDCRLAIAGRRYAVSDEACLAIRKYPAYFLAGAQGTENYPDPVTARLTLRQGVPGGWQSGAWLQQLVQKADTPAALAFALGQVFQAGQEVFANSYVNAFAGAPFSLQADDAVLARHVVIERYLDTHLPPLQAQTPSPQIPLAWLRTVTLSDADVLAQYRLQAATAHLAAMHDVAAALLQSQQGLDSVHVMATDMLAYFSSIPLSADALREEFGGSSAVARQAAAEKQAAINESRWLNAKATLSRQADTALRAEEEVRVLQAEHEAMEARLRQQEKQLAATPAQRRTESCRNVRKWINASKWTTNRVCETTAQANPAHGKAKAARDALRKDMEALNTRLQSVTVLKVVADAERDNAQQLLQQANEQRQQRALDMAADSDSLSVLLARRDDTLRALRTAVGALDELAVLSRQWQQDIVAADDDFLQLALQGSMHSIRSEERMAAYRKWLACSGRVFLEHASGESVDCLSDVPQLQQQVVLARLEAALKAPALQPLNDFYLGVRQRDLAGLQRQVRDSALALNAFVAPASALHRLARLDDVTATREQLQSLLSAPGQAPLLTVRNGADLIDADAGIDNAQPLDAEAFNALQYADRFARMALLPGRELNRLAGRMAGMRFARWTLHPEDSPRYSLLFQSLRSMEGNQQWQPYGLPYARLSGAAQPEDAGQRHFGYGPADGENAGLAIFINAEARQQVFRQLFPRPLSLLETHPRLQAPNYPFPSCAENPFPVTFTRAGKAAPADNSCSPRELVQH
ncbi:MAG: hypothetical protein REI12_00730 [Pedobacter sp.]|nr:hypothetical protein [Pedobacter sp.]